MTPKDMRRKYRARRMAMKPWVPLPWQHMPYWRGWHFMWSKDAKRAYRQWVNAFMKDAK